MSGVAYNSGLICFISAVMPSSFPPVVTEAAFLTLHYRLASLNGENIVSTFEGAPATLQLGQGQLASPLEACLKGLPEGAQEIFMLSPEKAFGPRNPDMILWVSRATLAQHSQSGEEYEFGDLVEFAAPRKEQKTNKQHKKNDNKTIFDFN